MLLRQEPAGVRIEVGRGQVQTVLDADKQDAITVTHYGDSAFNFDRHLPASARVCPARLAAKHGLDLFNEMYCHRKND